MTLWMSATTRVALESLVDMPSPIGDGFAVLPAHVLPQAIVKAEAMKDESSC